MGCVQCLPVSSIESRHYSVYSTHALGEGGGGAGETYVNFAKMYTGRAGLETDAPKFLEYHPDGEAFMSNVRVTVRPTLAQRGPISVEFGGLRLNIYTQHYLEESLLL